MNINSERDYMQLSYRRDGVEVWVTNIKGVIKKEINWCAIGSTDTQKAESFAYNILSMTKLADYFYEMMSNEDVIDTIFSHSWENDDYKFVPMEYDARGGFIGLDLIIQEVEYFSCGEILAEFKRRKLGNLRDDIKQQYNILREEAKNRIKSNTNTY